MKTINNKISWAWLDTEFYLDRNKYRSRLRLKKQRAKKNRKLGKTETFWLISLWKDNSNDK